MTSLLVLALFAAPLQSGPEIYAKCLENLRTYKSVSGRIEITSPDGSKNSRTFRILAPDCYEILDSDFELHHMGLSYKNYFPKEKKFVQPTWVDSISMSADLLPYSEILQSQNLPVDPPIASKTIDGQECYVLSVLGGHIALFVSKDNFAPLGYSIGGNVAIYKEVRINEPITRASFFWKPPKDATRYIPPEVEDLVGVGDTAPDFDLKLAGGSRKTLKSLLTGKNGLWLNFWSIGCVPCEEELDSLSPKIRFFENQGLRFVTANGDNREDQILEFLEKKSWSFPVLVANSKMFQAYGVAAVPTNYIIDSNGEVVAAVVGFDEPKIRAALAKIGVTWPG